MNHQLIEWISKVIKRVLVKTKSKMNPSFEVSAPGKEQAAVFLQEGLIEETSLGRKVQPEFNNQESDSCQESTKIVRRKEKVPKLKQSWLFVVVEGIDAGRQYIATVKQLTIGRKTDNFISLRDPKISRYHATIFVKETELIIEDLHSTNGTRVNGEKITTKKKLKSGDRVKIGETVLEIICKTE